MERRTFITLLGATVAWPFAASAQQLRKQHRLAFVHSGIPADKLTAAAGPFWVRRFFETLDRLGHSEAAISSSNGIRPRAAPTALTR
jgi:putative ABC transport system substrate-binding protein